MAEVFETPASSNIASVVYDEDSQEMDVTFRSGDVYKYFNVPRATVRSFQLANSAGEYFARSIRNRFAYEQQ